MRERYKLNRRSQSTSYKKRKGGGVCDGQEGMWLLACSAHNCGETENGVDFFYKGTVLLTLPSVSAEATGGKGG